MQFGGPSTLLRGIAEHPWASLRDFLALSAFMLFSVLLTQRYDVFGFLRSLADPRREISAAEAVMLGCVGAACVWGFIERRLNEMRPSATVIGADALASEMRVLRELAMQDPLTSLPNRRALLEALDLATQVPPQPGLSHAIFLLDLNGFKRVNDQYGHAVGDQVLQAAVNRFRRVTRSNDMFARLGGDEFAVLSRNVDETSARAIGVRFIGALSGKVRAGGAAHALGVAIGAALFPRDGDSSEKVLRHADVAMYRAKSQSGSSLVFFSPEVAPGAAASRKASA